MDKQLIQQAAELLASKKKVVIVPHANPDGDAMGSCLGLSHYLKLKGHESTVISPTHYAEFLNWLPGNEGVLQYGKEKKAADELIGNAQIIFCLDFNALSRVGAMEDELEKSKAVKVVIDHHIEPDDFSDLLFWNVKASSTCELVYDFIEDLGDREKVNLEIATCLYTGLVTDTGSFQFSCTTKRVHEIAAELIGLGVDNSLIYEKVYNSFTEDRLRLFGFCITEKMKVYPDQKAAMISLTPEELKRFNIRSGDTEGLVNFPLKMSHINFSVLIVDRTEKIKMSFRSKGNFNVQQMAKKYFSGGGHRNASGGASHDKLEEVINKFEEVLPQYTEELNYSL